MQFKEGDIVVMWLDLDALGFVSSAGGLCGFFETIGIVIDVSGPFGYATVRWLEADFADRHEYSREQVGRLILHCRGEL